YYLRVRQFIFKFRNPANEGRGIVLMFCGDQEKYLLCSHLFYLSQHIFFNGLGINKGNNIGLPAAFLHAVYHFYLGLCILLSSQLLYKIQRLLVLIVKE